jgi:hypothetical protein
MPFDLHRVMQNTTDNDQVGAERSVDEKVSRAKDDAMLTPRPLATMPQVIAANSLTDVGPNCAADSIGIG